MWETMRHRAVDSTLIHQHSSRSHLVISLYITVGPTAPLSSEQTCRLQGWGSFRTKLQLVDLAGSECVGKHNTSPGVVPAGVNGSCLTPAGQSGVTGGSLRETQCINRRSTLAPPLPRLIVNFVL